MTHRSLLAATAAATLALLVPGSLNAAKFPKIGVKCPEDYPEFRVDAEGMRDQCVAVAEPRCPAGSSLREDAEDDADVCSVPSEATASDGNSKPTCPKRYRLEVQEGVDACERKGQAKCRRGYEMKIGVGPDMCVR